MTNTFLIIQISPISKKVKLQTRGQIDFLPNRTGVMFYGFEIFSLRMSILGSNLYIFFFAQIHFFKVKFTI